MKLLVIIFALIIEQVRPAPHAVIDRWLRTWADFLADRLNNGERQLGIWSWALGALLPAVLLLLIQGFLHPIAEFVIGLALVWASGGFRQFSHYFTDIQLALHNGEVQTARAHLTAWTGIRTDRLSSSDVARLAMEQGLIAAYHGVFALLFWFIVLGPAGIVLWRLTCVLRQRWERLDASVPIGGSEFSMQAAQAYEVLSWLPVRLTAMTFAVIGDFEDAIYCWRQQAQTWSDASEGVLLASAAGALGVKLGLPIVDDIDIISRPELGLGADADADYMLGLIGLVWRALVVGIALLSALTAVSLVSQI